jgi:hypothetical protein
MKDIFALQMISMKSEKKETSPEPAFDGTQWLSEVLSLYVKQQRH